MTNDLLAIRAQTLALLREITEHPKPTYYIDGQTVAWNEYLARLQATIDWCNAQLNGEQPFEIHSQGTTE